MASGNLLYAFDSYRYWLFLTQNRPPNTAHNIIRDHVTDALAILHWLRVPERVNFKLALMAYRVLNGMAPSYLNRLWDARYRSIQAGVGRKVS